jgi:hypothetical protein
MFGDARAARYLAEGIQILVDLGFFAMLLPAAPVQLPLWGSSSFGVKKKRSGRI